MNRTTKAAALRALQTVIREHIGTDFDKDDTIQLHITRSHRNNQLLISLDGKGELEAEVTVNTTEIEVLIKNYRRPNQVSRYNPYTRFTVKQ